MSKNGFSRFVFIVITILVLVAGATSAEAQLSPLCDPPRDWVPTTPTPNETAPPKPRPASDCGFYAPAWQRFLVATQMTSNGPAFLNYPSFDDLFGSSTPAPPTSGTAMLDLSPRDVERPNSPPKVGAGIGQAVQTGLPGILIDQHGRPIYYAIHVNDAMQAFLKNNNLLTMPGIGKIDRTLTFPVGVEEFKSAWMVVDGPQSAPTYFVTQARVPHFTVSGGSLVQASDPKTGELVYDNVYVALLALHVVFTLPGHPEMIWSSFEHVSADGKGGFTRDNAPAAPANPSGTSPNTVISTRSFPLYKANTSVSAANQVASQADMIAHFDEATQSFTKSGLLQTSVYRPYPGSKTDPDPAEDDEVIGINNNVGALLNGHENRPDDLRRNYRLLGAVWINDPTHAFTANSPFNDPITLTTDDKASVLAGEARLGSTAIESFTELEAEPGGGSPNCFSCHDTQAVRDGEGTKLLPAAMLNVSHLISRYVEQHLAH